MTKLLSGKKIAAIVVCAGRGERSGLAYNKVLHYVGKKTVLEMTLDNLTAAGINEIVCVHSKADTKKIRELTAGYGARLVLGGETRTESVRAGLSALSGDTDIVAIHDGARPFASPAVILAALRSAAQHGSGVAAVRVIDSVREGSENGSTKPLDRSRLYAVQTPQAFAFERIKRAYDLFEGSCTDDSEVYERAGYTAVLTEGSYANKKITTAEDIFMLGAGYKIGAGFDVHPLVSGRRLVLGGVSVPFALGLDGHSDGDVLVHAVMDALLSAAGLPDIGVLFPNTDESYRGADSIRLLNEVGGQVARAGFRTINISCVVMAEAPKLVGHIPNMRKRIADALGICADSVNISATTTEGLGIVGEGKGIAASACALIAAE